MVLTSSNTCTESIERLDGSWDLNVSEIICFDNCQTYKDLHICAVVSVWLCREQEQIIHYSGSPGKLGGQTKSKKSVILIFVCLG